MRNIHYILMALLIICGCDKSSLSTNDIEYTNQYIFFDAGVESTKGTLVTGEVLPSAANTSFGVFAYRGSQNTPVFDMYNNNVAYLYRPSEGAYFKYDKLAIWTAGESHSFYAYYPYNATSIITGVGHNNGTAYITYSQPSALNNMVDVMTASVINTTSDEHTTSPVAFIFNHRLFAIGLTVVNAQTESKSNLEIAAANIEFVGVNTSAQFYIDANDTYNTASEFGNISHTYTNTPTTIQWSTNNTPVSYNFNDGNEFLLIPCNSLQVNINLKIKNVWKNEKGEEIYVEEIPYTLNKTITPTGGFVAGKKYQLTVTKTDKGVEFDCKESSGWTSVDVPTVFE